MNRTAFRHIGAVAGAAAIAITFTVSGTTASASNEQRDVATDRPCFMIRSHWNNAEGPQPTCPKAPYQMAAPDEAGASQPSPSPRITDFMP